jgi:hypothetical protein
VNKSLWPGVAPADNTGTVPVAGDHSMLFNAPFLVRCLGAAMLALGLAACGGGGGGGSSSNSSDATSERASRAQQQTDPLAALQAEFQAEQYVVQPLGDGRQISITPVLNKANGEPVTTLDDLPEGIAHSAWAAQTGTRLPLRIVLRDGTYRLSRTWSWGPSASGREGSAVHIVAANPGRAIITGAARVNLSRDAHGGQSTVVADLSGLNLSGFEQLWVNDRRAIRARAPNAGDFFFVKGVVSTWNGQATMGGTAVDRQAFVSDSAATAYLSGLSASALNGAVVVAAHSWTSSHHRISQLGSGQQILVSPASQWAFLGRGEHQRYFIENIPSALDAEREWFHDTASQQLRYRPTSTERTQALAIDIPQISTLVDVRGDLANNRWAEHIVFRGLTFRHAGYQLPAAGLIDPQAAVAVPAAVMVNSARHITFSQCEISRVGGYAIWLRDRVQNGTVEGCEIYDAGAGGIRVGLPNQGAGAHPTGNNTIRGNRVHAMGHQFPGAVGIWLGQTSNNRIEQNLVGDTTYTGISVGWSWGYANSTAQDNLIAQNYIYNVMQGSMSDGGGIYTLGRSPGTVIRGNVIRDVRAFNHYGSGGWGIYNDEGSSDILVDGNIVINTDHGGYMLHYGSNNTVTNNLFAGGRLAELQIGRNEVAPQATFENNRLFPTVAAFVSYKSDGVPAITFRNNQVSRQYMSLTGLPSVCGSGCTLTDNLQLVPGAMLELPKLYQSGSLVNWPTALPVDWRTTGVSSTDSPSLIWGKSTGFEFDAATAPLGSRPMGFSVVPADRPELISVSQNAQGERCLAFQDGAGMTNPWEPFGYINTDYSTGHTAVTFTLKPDATTEFTHEWRDPSYSQFKTGPAVTFSASRGVVIGGQVVAPLNVGEWITVTVHSNQGPSPKWDLTLTYADGTVRTVTDRSPVTADWVRTRALYFISNAANTSTPCIGRWSATNTP